MDIRIDADSPVPLYHQIAEAIRYLIATGGIRPGSKLPALRTAAVRWGVNLHTVRTAYAELAHAGLVQLRRVQGAVVLPAADRGGNDEGSDLEVAVFLGRVANEAQERYGLSPFDLARLLAIPPRRSTSNRVTVLECSETQCADLAEQLERRWRITAEPWCLSRPDDLPDGTIIATYFHYNDIRLRWSERLNRINFVAIHPDESLPNRVAARCRRGRPRDLIILERDPVMLSMIQADLSALFAGRDYSLSPLLLGGNRDILPNDDDRLVLVAPRLWGGLSPEQRTDHRVLEIRYVYDAEQIERLAAELGWSTRNLRVGETA